jgi:hypothetical protein
MDLEITKSENTKKSKSGLSSLEKFTFWGTNPHLVRTVAYTVEKPMKYNKTRFPKTPKSQKVDFLH